MDYQWGSLPGGAKKERRGKRAELPEEVAKKLKSCSVMGCEEWRDLSSPTTYHCFPTGDKNQQRWEIWTSLLQKSRDDESWIPFRGSLVCSHHFISTDFVSDPNQKRRKLVKNAIPSIFPNFTVDLNDPSFALDDSNDASGTVENGDGSYYYNEEPNQQEYGYEYIESVEDDGRVGIPEVHIQYDDEMDEEDIQYVTYPQPKQQTQISKPLPKLTPATTLRKSTEFTQNVMEPPKKKVALGGGLTIDGFSKKPPLTFKGAVASNSEIRVGSSSASNNGNASNGRGPPKSATFQTSSASKLYQQLCKSMPNTKFPISWNSDLEIEVVESNSDDSSVSSLKQRLEELETENQTLKQKFGAQIRALQRKIKEQDKIINDYVLHFNSIEHDEEL